MKEEICAACKYFDGEAEHLNKDVKIGDWIKGYCRRHAPSPMYSLNWPTVQANDWCGEFKALQPKEYSTD